MASKFRFVDDVQIARQHGRPYGALGEILLFNNAFTGYVDMAGRWNSDSSRSGGGVIIDNGTHSVDIVRWLFGPISEVLAVEGRRAQPIAVEDTAQLFVRAGDGVLGSIDLSWSLDKFAPHYIEIFGTKGTVTIGFQQSRYKLDGNEWTDFGSGYSKIGRLPRPARELRRRPSGVRATTLVTADDAVASVRGHRSRVRIAPRVELGAGRRFPARARRGLNRDSVAAAHPPHSARRGRRRAGRGDQRLGQCPPARPVSYRPRLHHRRQDLRRVRRDIGDMVKLNAFVYVCAAVTIEDGVMVGAHSVFTNDRFPRATDPDLNQLRSSEPDGAHPAHDRPAGRNAGGPRRGRLRSRSRRLVAWWGWGRS